MNKIQKKFNIREDYLVMLAQIAKRFDCTVSDALNMVMAVIKINIQQDRSYLLDKEVL